MENFKELTYVQRKFQPAHLAFAFFIACAFLLLRGYVFNDGDQSEHLPQVYQLINPELYPADFFMEGHHQTFTMRHYYIQLVYALSYIAPVSWICFLLTLLFLTLSAWSWMKITQAFKGYTLAVYLSPVFILFIFYKFTIGGNHIQYNELDCGTIGQGLASAALLLFLRNKWMWAGALLGIASLFQVLAGWQLFMLLSGFVLLHFRLFRFSSMLKFVLAYLLLAGFILVPMLSKQFLNAMDFDKLQYARIIYYFRNPLHFIPSLFPLADYIKYGLLLMITFPFLMQRRVHGRRFILSILMLHSLGLIIYTIGIEVFQVYDLAKFQWFKATIWTSALCGVVLSKAVAKLLLKSAGSIRIPSWLSLAGAAACLFVVLNSAMIPWERLQGRYKAGNYKKSELTLMHEWIEQNTPVNAVFLCSPDNESFACEAKRSMPINYKAIIHEPFFMFPWYERVKKIYHTAIENHEGRGAHAHALQKYQEVSEIPADIHIDYRIDDLRYCKAPEKLGQEIYRSGSYVLTKIAKQNTNAD